LVDGGARLDRCIRWIAEDIGVLPAGDLRRSPARVVAEMRRAHLLEEIEARCDVIVADLPPVLGSPVGTQVADLFAPLVLVVRAGSTPVAQVAQAVRELPVQPTVLLNQRASAVPSWLRRSLDDW
jgi:Mrp family chromosome partitioning ATPase